MGFFVYSARVYRTEVTTRGSFEFACVGCGHRQTGYLRASARGVSESPYGLRDDGAAREAHEVAEREATSLMRLAADLCACPECGFRARGLPYVRNTLVVATIIAACAGAVMALGSYGVGLIAGLAVGATWLGWRTWRYVVATRPSMTRFAGYS